MWELTNSLLALRDPASASLHLPWLRTLSGRLDGLDLRSAVELVPGRKYSPDFISPPPAGPLGDIHAELAQVRAAPAARIRQEMEIFRRDHRAERIARPWLEHPRRQVVRLAETLAEYWRRALEPSWPRIRALLDADLAYRARRLSVGGPAAVFADLHPGIAWDGDRLRVPVSLEKTLDLRGRGLLLMPSVFHWRGPQAIVNEPWQPTVVYPARGLATVWEEARPAPEALARLIGSGRAAVLAELDAPRTTTEVARRLGVSAGGVSQHLGVLRDAGLVTGRREGREVLYLRTPVADALVA